MPTPSATYQSSFRYFGEEFDTDVLNGAFIAIDMTQYQLYTGKSLFTVTATWVGQGSVPSV